MMSIRSKLSPLGMKCLNGWVPRRQGHTLIQNEDCVPIKIWKDGIVDIEPEAMDYVNTIAKMKEIWHPQGLAVMPSVHLSEEKCVGVVLASSKAVIPSLVGIDLGCGIMAVQLSLTANQLPSNLRLVRIAIEEEIPDGRPNVKKTGDHAAWWRGAPKFVLDRFDVYLLREFEVIRKKMPWVSETLRIAHRDFAVLGIGSHYFEVNLDENDHIWLTVHSGSGGIGSMTAKYYRNLARTETQKHTRYLPHKDFGYFSAGTKYFNEYIRAVSWVQKYAKISRELMIEAGIKALRSLSCMPPFEVYSDQAVHCHHNYVSLENHFGEDLYITRRGAIRAAKGMLGVIPGSMGANSFIVRGLGNPDSYETCSNGAGRRVSLDKSLKAFTVKDHIEATENVECRKDAGVLDVTPPIFKPIESVIAAQKDLIEVVHTLRPIVSVKGGFFSGRVNVSKV